MWDICNVHGLTCTTIRLLSFHNFYSADGQNLYILFGSFYAYIFSASPSLCDFALLLEIICFRFCGCLICFASNISSTFVFGVNYIDWLIWYVERFRIVLGQHAYALASCYGCFALLGHLVRAGWIRLRTSAGNMIWWMKVRW